MVTICALIVIISILSWYAANTCADNFHCDPRCKCSLELKSVWCIGQKLAAIPFLPANAELVYLQYNNISALTNISFKYTMEARELDLSFNNIQSVDVASFWKLPNLTVLRLQHNQIHTLPINLLDHQTELNFLDLSFNEIKMLPSDLLRYSSQLEHLNINNNHLHELPWNMLKYNKKITVLNLSHNLFGSFYKWPFRDLNEIIYLNLSSVYLNMVYGDMFLGMKNLQVLDLSKNQIDFLDRSSFEGLQSLEKIYLHSNPLHCDCHLNDFFIWLKNASNLFGDENVFPECATPASMKGLSLRDLMTENLTCQLHQSVQAAKTHPAVMSYHATNNNQYKSELEPPPYNPWMGVGTACTLSGMLVVFLLCMACDKAKRFYYKKRWERRKLRNRTFHTYTVNIKDESVDEEDGANVDTVISVKKEVTILDHTDSIEIRHDNTLSETMINDARLPMLIQDTEI